jgi:hypothetical protein
MRPYEIPDKIMNEFIVELLAGAITKAENFNEVKFFNEIPEQIQQALVAKYKTPCSLMAEIRKRMERELTKEYPEALAFKAYENISDLDVVRIYALIERINDLKRQIYNIF